MKIRQTTIFDLPDLMDMFEYGRKYQRELGNHYQWRNGEPSRETLQGDIQKETSYVGIVDEHDHTDVPKGTIVATFNLSPEEQAVFETLTEGEWLSDEPYFTIQRMCSNGKLKGASQSCIKWILERYSNLRIYTHETNKPMIHIVEKYGFTYCGDIHPSDGEPRKAYQYEDTRAIEEVM